MPLQISRKTRWIVYSSSRVYTNLDLKGGRYRGSPPSPAPMPPLLYDPDFCIGFSILILRKSARSPSSGQKFCSLFRETFCDMFAEFRGISQDVVYFCDMFLCSCVFLRRRFGVLLKMFCTLSHSSVVLRESPNISFDRCIVFAGFQKVPVGSAYLFYRLVSIPSNFNTYGFYDYDFSSLVIIRHHEGV